MRSRFLTMERLPGHYAGGRLLICTVAGALVFLALPQAIRLPMRVATAWVVAVTLFLAITAMVMAGATPARMRQRARLLDERAGMILVMTIFAAAISMLALGFTLHKVPDESPLAFASRLLLAGLTVFTSWTLVHTVFALHYAHQFYGDGPAPGGDDDRGGLAFPGEGPLDYWDFTYFSFVIGMTCQVSDVQVTTASMRRITLVHGVLSFFFNTVILALTVNLLAGSL